MKLATIMLGGEEIVAINIQEKLVSIKEINKLVKKNWSHDLLSILQKGQLPEILSWFRGSTNELKQLPFVLVENASFAPLYRNPDKIWGVGMNYMEKAVELSGKPPEEEPVVFMKPNTSLIGHMEPIKLPDQSSQVTAEAELAIIIGKTCKDVSEEDACDVVAGFTTTLDMTAKDIHARNPRFLQRSKSFDTFFSFGPFFHTVDECMSIKDLAVRTLLNGEVYHQNVVANMMYQPWWIVSFFSQIMTLQPGDIIMTGTPGSVVIRDGDVAGCSISGFRELANPVSKEKPDDK